MENSNEVRKTTPRLKATPMAADPKLSIGIGEKGGISVYGLGRFPLTLFDSQWDRITPEVLAEIHEYRTANAALLAVKPVTSKANDGKPEQYKVNTNDLLIAEQEAERLGKAGDVAGAIRFATIASVGKLNNGKVSPEDLLAIMQVKARK